MTCRGPWPPDRGGPGLQKRRPRARPAQGIGHNGARYYLRVGDHLCSGCRAPRAAAAPPWAVRAAQGRRVITGVGCFPLRSCWAPRPAAAGGTAPGHRGRQREQLRGRQLQAPRCSRPGGAAGPRRASTPKTLTGANWQLSRRQGATFVVLKLLGFRGARRAARRRPALGAPRASISPATACGSWAIDIRDDPASAEAFMRKFRISYPSLNDPERPDRPRLPRDRTAPRASPPTPGHRPERPDRGPRVIGKASYNGLKALIAQVSAGHS